MASLIPCDKGSGAYAPPHSIVGIEEMKSRMPEHRQIESLAWGGEREQIPRWETIAGWSRMGIS